MQQFLFIVEIPKANHTIPPSHVTAQWQSFEGELDATQSSVVKSTKTSRNVWLFDSKNALPALLELSGLAEKHGLAYKAYLISGDVTLITKQ
jgi:hypothetical protein